MNAVIQLAGALIIGVLAGAATFTPWLWPVAPLSVTVLLYFVFRSPRAPWLMGHVFGSGLLGATFIWGFDALPLNWLGIKDTFLGFCIMLGVWAGYSVVIASPLGLWAYCMRRVGEKRWLILVAPFGWIVMEFMRAFVHAVSTWGSGTTFGFDLSFGFVGYAFAWSGYLWLARLGGVVALSFFVVLLGTALFLLWKRYEARPRVALAYSAGMYGLIIVIGIFVPPAVSSVYNPGVVTIDGVRIALLNTQIPPALKREDEERLHIAESVAAAVLEAQKSSPDIIILPEYSGYLKGESNLADEISQEVRAGLVEHGTILIDSQRSPENFFGSISFFDGRQVLEEQEKRLLIPLGEYFPYPLIQIFQYAGLGSEVEDILQYRTYTPSREAFSERTFRWKGLTLGVLACSEVFSPFSYRQTVAGGAEVLVNVASHSWIRGRSGILFRETLAMARVHSVFTGKIFLQATNYDPSFILYPAGRM